MDVHATDGELTSHYVQSAPDTNDYMHMHENSQQQQSYSLDGELVSPMQCEVYEYNHMREQEKHALFKKR